MTASPKVRALSARPRVAVTIDVGDNPTTAKSLLIRGTAILRTEDGVPDVAEVAGECDDLDGGQDQTRDAVGRGRGPLAGVRPLLPLAHARNATTPRAVEGIGLA